LNISAVPKRIAKARKDGHVHVHAQDEDDNLLLLDRKKASEKSSIHVMEASSSTAKTIVDAEDSETEDEDGDSLLNKPNTLLPPPKNVVPLPTPARSLSPQVDPGRAPNMIIGTTYPLKDFTKNIAQGDVVTRAIEDLSTVITEIVMRPFASRRKSELLECMTMLRKTSLEVF
jgi:ATP-dependent DNA helicase 2 subunit 2